MEFKLIYEIMPEERVISISNSRSNTTALKESNTILAFMRQMNAQGRDRERAVSTQEIREDQIVIAIENAEPRDARQESSQRALGCASQGSPPLIALTSYTALIAASQEEQAYTALIASSQEEQGRTVLIAGMLFGVACLTFVLGICYNRSHRDHGI